MFDAMDGNLWDNAEQQAHLAYENYEKGHLNQAFSQLSQAIEINPDNPTWLFNAGLTLDGLEKYEEAIEYYKQALEYQAEDPEILNSIAIDYTRTANYDLAISIFEQIEKIDPKFEPCYCNRIITYTEMEQHKNAEEMFYLAQQLDPDCPICFYNIGNSLFSQGDYKRAIWCWKKTESLESEHPQINYRIAQAYWADGDYQKAKIYFVNEIRKNPGNIDILLDYGLFLFKTGDIENAKEKFNRILEINPDSSLGLLYLGEIELHQKNQIKAIELFDTAIKKSPETAGPRYRLAQIAYSDGKEELANDLLTAEYQLDVTDIKVLFSMGSLFLQLCNYDYATDCFLKIADQDRNNSDAFYYLGMTLAMQEEYEGTLQFFQHSFELGNEKPELLADMTLVLVKMKEYRQALEYINLAVEKDTKNKSFRKITRSVKIKLLLNNVYHTFCKISNRLKGFKFCN